ncbi:MAG: AMP-binding protein [Myxococcales bacterium FL481]|nr:MAG: AMP-binding protein [Myxococcales bacterium FL481]
MPKSYALFGRHEPGAPVVWTDTGVYSSQAVAEMAKAVAGQLPGVGADEAAVSIDVQGRLGFVVALLGAWLRGYVVRLGAPRAATDAESGSADQWIHDGDRSTGVDIRMVLRDRAGPRGASNASIVLPAGQRLVSLWTSGSTGEPQLHHKDARQLLGEAEMLREAFGLQRADRLLATAPPEHVYGLLFGVVLPLVSGSSFVDASPLQPTAVAAVRRAATANVLVSVPAHLRALVSLGPHELDGLRRVFSSGAPLLSDTARSLHQRHQVTVTEVLGSTETGGIAWREQVAADTRWRALPGVKLQQDDAARLVVASPFLPDGIDRWTSAEHVTFASDGGFVHHGRIDGIVKVAGKRVALAELERALFAMPGVTDAAVAAREISGARGTEIAALVVGDRLDAAGIRAALLRRFDRVVVPRRVAVVDRVPRGANGKVTKSAVFAAWDG